MLDEPDNLSPFSFDWTNFDVAIVIHAHPRYHHRSHVQYRLCICIFQSQEVNYDVL